MRSLALGATLLAAQASSSVATSSSNSAPRAVQGNGVFRVPVSTVEKPKNRITRRQDGDTVATVLENMDFFYATTLGLGTPAQDVTVLVDTGSSELWVNPDCSRAGSRAQTRECQSYGQYNPDDSTTPPVGPFSGEEINYGDPSDPSTLSSVNIEYYADNVGLGDATIRNQTFGVVTSSSSQTQGIMGLAPDLIYGFGGESNYSLLLNTMAAEGIIPRRLFSLDLRHASSETGAIIYGGVDRNKFIGNLEKKDIVRGIQGEYRLAVNLQTIGVTSGSSSDDFDLDESDQNVMLDSGTTLSRMHSAAALPVLDALGAQDDGEGYYVVPCSVGQIDGTIDFGFGGVTVRVPLSDFVLNVGDPNYCYAGVTLTTDQQILGDTVLRAGYFVFDWDSETISIAQAANCGDEDIVSFDPDNDSVTGNCQSSDLLSGTGTITATRTADVRTTAYTTTYTITSCPGFDDECQTGRVTTATITAEAEPTETGGGDDNGAMRMDAAGGLAAGFGALAAMYNVM